MSIARGPWETFQGWIALLWRIISWNPFLWPLIWWFRFLVWVCTAVLRFFGFGANVASDSGKVILHANGSAPPFVLAAALLLKAGHVFRQTFDANNAPSFYESAEDFDASVEDFRTPPSSPPPFDAVSPDMGDGEDEDEKAGAPALTLRDRLRGFKTAVNMLTRLGSDSLKGTYSHVPTSERPDFRLGVNRSMRAYNLFEEIKQEYVRVMAELPADHEETVKIMQELHTRSAKKCLELARENGGLYTKAAQFVASLQGGAGDQGIPKPYVDVLRVLTDAAPTHEFDEMDEVLVKEFGCGAAELYARFDPVPIAAASLAQVHRATLHSGEEVAVKLLYPNLRKEMASDFAMFRRLGSQIKPGGYNMEWLVEDFEEAIKSELDCENEASNLEMSARLLAGRPGVRLPRVVWELTGKDVLTMEFIPGLMRMTEPSVLKANGLDLAECGQVVSDALTELALVHGHVHGDPHAGNIYVVAERGGVLNRGVRPGVVILDHGLYHHMEEPVRRQVCLMFVACISRQRAEIARLGEKLAGPLHRFFPLLLSPWFILGTSLSGEDVQAARDNKLPPSVSVKDVGDAMTSLHALEGNVLALLHSFGYVRGLLNAVDFGERRRLKSIARLALFGTMPKELALKALQLGEGALPLRWRLRLWRTRAQVDVTALLLHLLSAATAQDLDASDAAPLVLASAQLLLSVGRWRVWGWPGAVWAMAAGERRQAGGSERGLQRPGEVVKEGEGLGRDFGGGHDQWSEETGSMMSRAESEDVYGYAGSVRSSPDCEDRTAIS